MIKQQSIASALTLAMLLMMFAAIIVLARAPDHIYDPNRVPYSAQHTEPLTPAQAELTQRFDQAIMMLHAKQYEHAVTALHRVIQLSPRMPEAYVNMGYALFGLKRHRAAYDFFKTASDLHPYQANAYWGMAVALEAAGDLRAALGAMRIYIHLAEPGDPFVRRARSALWEWGNEVENGPPSADEKKFLERGARRWEERMRPRTDSAEDGTRIRVD